MLTVYCPACYSRNVETAERCVCCGALLAHSARRDHTTGLIWALRHPEPTVPPRAAWILGERRDPEAVRPLMEIAETSHDLGTLEEVVTALGKIGHPVAVPVIANLLHASYLTVRVPAAAALGALGGPEAASALEQASNDASQTVCDAASSALEQIDPSGGGR